MGFFAQLETACATAVERAFAAAFPTALEPAHIARKLVAAFEAGPAPAGRAGRLFVVRMSAADYARLERDLPYLERQWATMLGRLAERSGRPQRAPEVRAEADRAVAAGTVAIGVEPLAEARHLALRIRRGLPPDGRVALGPLTAVGRDPASDLVLADPRASRKHVEIAREGATYRIRDLGSSNGTRLNGRRITDGELGLGDVVVIGETEIVVEPDDGVP